MQNDLISRSALVRHLVNWQMESFSKVGHEKEYNLLDMIIRGVENAPTAYDVEKVVEQICDCYGCSGCCNCHEEQRMMECEDYARVYEIVRNGGKEGNEHDGRTDCNK